MALIGTLPSRTATWPTSDQYAWSARVRAVVVGAVALALAIVSAAAIGLTDGRTPLVVLLSVALVTLAVLARPIAGVYIVFASAILFEQYEIVGITTITTQLHMFQNISGYTDIPLCLRA